MTIRTKFHCHFIDKADNDAFRVVNLSAVSSESDENSQWSKDQPSGQFTLKVSNPSAFDAFEIGKDYYIDVQPAE